MKEWRRHFVRVKCSKFPQAHVPILLHFGQEKQPDGWGVVENISLGGVGMQTRSQIKVGQAIYVSFVLAERFTFVNAKSIVRRVTYGKLYHKCGIEFESLADRHHLEDALNALAEAEERTTQ